MALDLATLVGAIAISYAMRRWLGEVLSLSPISLDRYVLDPLLIVPVQILVFRLHGLYDFDRILAGTREYQQVARSVTVCTWFVMAISYFTGETPIFSRSWLVLVWLATIGSVGIGRFAIRRVVRRLRRGGFLRTRVAIVGASPFGVAIAEQLQAAKNEGLDVVGFLDEYVPLGQRLLDDLAVVGRPGDLLSGVGFDLADEYVLVPEAVPHERLEAIMLLMVSQGGPTVRVAVSSTNLLTNGLLVAERASVPLVTLQRARIVGVDAALKRSLDLTGAVLGLILLALPTLVVLARACVIGIRPLLRRQEIRVADRGKTTLWLVASGVSNWLPIRGMPVLFAVLLGRLSLVGPRPMASDVLGAASTPPELTAAKPGITGPWRMVGPGASLASQMMQDLTYVRNYTIWEDLRVLWQTVTWTFSGRAVNVLGRWEARPAGPDHPGIGT